MDLPPFPWPPSFCTVCATQCCTYFVLSLLCRPIMYSEGVAVCSNFRSLGHKAMATAIGLSPSGPQHVHIHSEHQQTYIPANIPLSSMVSIQKYPRNSSKHPNASRSPQYPITNLQHASRPTSMHPEVSGIYWQASRSLHGFLNLSPFSYHAVDIVLTTCILPLVGTMQQNGVC